MVSLARASLIYERRKYFAGVLAITFCGVLVIVQLALLLGLFGTVSVVIDQSAADLWIGFRNTPSVDYGRPVANGSDSDAWINPSVVRVERFLATRGELRRPDGAPIPIVVNAIDSSPGGLAFARKLTPEQRRLLDTPDTILMDASDKRKLKADVGDAVEINGRRVRVGGVLEGLRAVGNVQVIASFATARTLSPKTGDATTYYLLQLREGAAPATVSAQLADKAEHPRYSVWIARDFSVRSQSFWLLESGAGIGAGFASLLAFIVGFVITSQTLSAAVSSSLREFAALRALGIPKRSFQALIIEQSFWIGLAGLTMTYLLSLGIARVGERFHVAMSFPWWMVGSASLSIMVVALLSGVMALRPLFRAEPASLLR